MTFILLALIINIVLTFVNLFLLLAPFFSIESKIWRSLNISKLRKYVTRYRKVNQPLSSETYGIAKKNIIWHILLTILMVIQCLTAIRKPSEFYILIAVLSTIPSMFWFVGSIIQRQKMNIIYKKTKLQTGLKQDL